MRGRRPERARARQQRAAGLGRLLQLALRVVDRASSLVQLLKLLCWYPGCAVCLAADMIVYAPLATGSRPATKKAGWCAGRA